jgi:hypothetical protein
MPPTLLSEIVNQSDGVQPNMTENPARSLEAVMEA